MDRLECFEKMLADLMEQAEHEHAEMERLKAEGKEKPQRTDSISEIGCFTK